MKYVIIADSVTLKGKIIRKGKRINLDEKEAKKLIEIKAIEPENKPEPKKETKKEG